MINQVWSQKYSWIS